MGLSEINNSIGRFYSDLREPEGMPQPEPMLPTDVFAHVDSSVLGGIGGVSDEATASTPEPSRTNRNIVAGRRTYLPEGLTSLGVGVGVAAAGVGAAVGLGKAGAGIGSGVNAGIRSLTGAPQDSSGGAGAGVGDPATQFGFSPILILGVAALVIFLVVRK